MLPRTLDAAVVAEGLKGEHRVAEGGVGKRVPADVRADVHDCGVRPQPVPARGGLAEYTAYYYVVLLREEAARVLSRCGRARAKRPCGVRLEPGFPES